MRRRGFIAGLGSVAAWPVVGRAQQSSKIHRVAWVSASEPVADMNESSGDRGYRAFIEELRRLGYIEGRNLILERYSGEGRTERYSIPANCADENGCATFGKFPDRTSAPHYEF
jgi:putative ABC transport system substrate-binding protein